ncbi:MAG: cation:proton antiporter [Nanoarchaeota archaeon]
MISLDPYLLNFVILSFIALLIAFVLRIYKQPSVISYILTGIILGPYGFKLIKDTQMINHLGNFGVVLLLFFVGMEVDMSKLVKNWKIGIIGTTIQIILSVLVVAALGHYLQWPIARIVLIGFVVSLSSTAVIIKILETKNELNTKTGQNVISILLIQDVAVIPMMMVLSFLGGESISLKSQIMQIIGGNIAIIFLIWMINKKKINLPFSSVLKSDPELQVLTAFVVCFGISLLSGVFQLSTALGAFIAGVFLSTAKETDWVHHSLHPFKVVFLALFFISIGMLIDLYFLWTNIGLILAVLIMVLFTNTFINALIFRISKNSWTDSLYGGAVLGQIGEFSFILVAIGLQTHLISNFAYQLTIEVIALSLIISPFWITFFCQFVRTSKKLIDKNRVLLTKRS